jgi:TldD protein
VVPSRYEVIFDARATAQILARTVGVAAELDRALGYEANAGGTSYLAPPAEMLGSFHLGSELLGVRTNRSRVGGYSTGRWDDEGVPPEDYPVVEKGMLVDYHTTRELAPALAEWNAKRGTPVRSHGCAGSADAGGVAMAVPPDLELLPGKARHSLADLVAGMERGLVICGGRVYADRQQLNGEVDGEMVYEVRKGKRTRCVSYAEALFRAPELWKNLVALGGEGSGIWTAASIWKGQPAQEVSFGVGAVPARFRGVAVTDIMRKA